MRPQRLRSAAQMGTAAISLESTFSMSITKVTPLQWKASTLTCSIISRLWHGAAGAFPESWRTFRPFLLFLFALITALVLRKVVFAPAILGLLSLFRSLTSFNSALGHSLRFFLLDSALFSRYNKANAMIRTPSAFLLRFREPAPPAVSADSGACPGHHL